MHPMLICALIIHLISAHNLSINFHVHLFTMVFSAQAKLLHSQRQLSTILPSNQHRSTLPITALIQLQQQQQHRLTLPRPFFPLHHHPYHRPSDRRLLLLLLLLEEMAAVEEPVAMATVAMGYVW